VEAVQSVLNQTYAEFEVIIVDDASSDGTEDSIRMNFSDPIHQGKVRYFKNETQRERSFCRNRGIRESRGDYLGFLDDDDLFLPNHLNICANSLGDYDCVGTSVMEVDSAGEPIREYLWPFKGRLRDSEMPLLGLGLCCLNTIVRKSIVHKVGGFREYLSQGEDIDFFMRVSMISMVRLLDEVTCLRRVHKSSYTDDWEEANHLRFLDGLAETLFKNADDLGFILNRRVMGYLCLYLSWNFLNLEKGRDSSKRLREAVAVYPKILYTEPKIWYVLARLLLSRSELASNNVKRFTRWLRHRKSV